MTPTALAQLLTDDLQVAATPYSTGIALRAFLLMRPEVRQVCEGLKDGTLQEDDVRVFTTSLFRELKAGVLFRHDVTVAALAVALEGVGTPFARNLLIQLANARLGENPLSYRVAQEALEHLPGKGTIDLGKNGGQGVETQTVK